MHTGDYTQIKTIDEFYPLIRSDFAKAHGEDYLLYLDRIESYIQECQSYRELGTMQGASLSAALTNKIIKAHCIDIDMSRIRQLLHIFKPYNVVFTESDSLSDRIVPEPTDFLLIDSLHQPTHVTSELNKYGKKTNKYILLHDTHKQSGIRVAVDSWVKINPEWEVVEHCKLNVGFSVLKKV